MIPFRIVALTALALVSIVPLAKPVPPTLTIQSHSQSIVLTQWQNTVTTSNICPPFSPLTAIVEGLNFTENLASRDAGSTFVQFRGLPSSQTSYIVKASDLTNLFLSELWCSTEGNATASLSLVSTAQSGALLGSSGLWKVPASCNYVLLSAQFYLSTPPPFLVEANETWTVTTIS